MRIEVHPGPHDGLPVCQPPPMTHTCAAHTTSGHAPFAQHVPNVPFAGTLPATRPHMPTVEAACSGGTASRASPTRKNSVPSRPHHTFSGH